MFLMVPGADPACASFSMKAHMSNDVGVLYSNLANLAKSLYFLMAALLLATVPGLWASS